MPRYAGLSPAQATTLSRQAFYDFPGLFVGLKPLFRVLPLSERCVPDGFVLIIGGSRGQKPWFELTDPRAYEALYIAVYERFAPAMLPDDLEWAESEPLPVPAAVKEKIRLLNRS